MSKPVWREVFLEIALRAIKKVHLSHTPWLLKKRTVAVGDLSRLNNSKGIFAAQETSVAAEISNEFIYSSYTNGLKIIAENKKKPESRYFEILREVTFREKNKKPLFQDAKGKLCSQRENVVDLVVRRLKYTAGTGYAPSLIELKRYYRYKFRIQEGHITRAGANDKEIARDIENLKLIKKHKKDIEKIAGISITDYKPYHPFLYVLLWGESEPNENIKDTLCNKKLKGLIHKKDIYLKWLPLIYYDKKDGGPPIVKKWLWVALIEIDPPKTPRRATKSK